MITYRLGVTDLAATRFAISPIQETVCSLWAVCEPGRAALHLPWLRAIRPELEALDTRLLLSIVGPTRALPDFLTPRPVAFAPSFTDELTIARATPADRVRGDLEATYRPDPVPEVWKAVRGRRDGPVLALRDALCDLLERYWEVALQPVWAQMRLVLEADATYRARQLAAGGFRLLFADLHPNVRFDDGVLSIDDMIGRHDVDAAGHGLLLLPSLFTIKPVPPMSADELPWLCYPSRGVGTLWGPAPRPDGTVLAELLGRPRATLVRMLDEPLPTSEIARRLAVTPSAVSQHLQVLHAGGLVTRARDGRTVLYRRSALGDQLAGGAALG
ncbi:MAG: Bacterial regulatory protein arsR family [Solirubrobacterales bacterium]|nr:Bacterial regulatory protein arsR family [Solirubrobacterales bacterium]